MATVLERPESSELSLSNAKHREAIADLVQQTGHPEPLVTQIYAAELLRLRSTARVTDYLVLFAVRRTRDVLSGAGGGAGRH